MLEHFIPQNFEPFIAEPIIPVSDDYFIHWLFKHRCIMCKKPATEINEIIPRSRSKKSILTWQNRVTLCHSCHEEFHRTGVTKEKIAEMQEKRKQFLLAMDRGNYVE